MSPEPAVTAFPATSSADPIAPTSISPWPKPLPFSERFQSELRLEAFNIFNHTEFDNPDTNIFSPTFGQIVDTDIGTGASHTERIVQLALRLTF
jgi:hypothetical protein